MCYEKKGGKNCQNLIYEISGLYCMDIDHLFDIVVSTSDLRPRGPGFDSWLYPRNFSGSIGSATVSTQPREDNCVDT